MLKAIMNYATWNKKKLGTAVEYLEKHLPKSGVRIIGKYVRLEKELKEYKEKNIKGIYDEFLNYETTTTEVKLSRERKKEVLMALINSDSSYIDKIKLNAKELEKEGLVEEHEIKEKKGTKAITTTELNKFLVKIGYKTVTEG